MESQNLPATQEESKKPVKTPNPARKWLIVSACGLFICLSALGYHFAAGGSSSSDPLPKKVLMQVFGFTPYYFTNNTPPDRLKLQQDTPKFFGNALTFTLANSKGQTITVSEKALPDKYTSATKADDEAVEAPQGNGVVNAVLGGHITATLVTKDKTLISLESSDILNSDTMKDLINGFIAIDKTTGLPLAQ